MSKYLKILEKQENKDIISISTKSTESNALTLEEQRVLAFDTILYNFLKQKNNIKISYSEFEKQKEKIEKRMVDSVMKKISSIEKEDIILEYEEIIDGILYFNYKKLY